MPLENNINLSSEPEFIGEHNHRSQTEINDLIGNPPGWLLRSGITMIAIVTVIIVGGSYFFKYPDKLIGQGIVTSTTPPIEIISRTTGYIDVIHYPEGSDVESGDPIIYINNTTDQSELSQLQNWIEQYVKVDDTKKYLDLPFVFNLQLGSIQGEYANLQLRYNELLQTLKDGVIYEQIKSLSREIDKIKTLNESQRREKVIYSQELELSRKDYSRNENLEKDGAISELDLEKAKTELLQKERQFEGMNNSIIQNNIRMEQLSLEKLKLKEQRSNEIKAYQFSISELIAKIRSSITKWGKTYTVSAPIDGKIFYHKDITLKKNLILGDVIGYIIPHSSETNYVSAVLPGYNIGKVEKEQKVILKFDAYPHKEYGVVVSEVKDMSKMPELNADGKSQYEIIIPLNDVIITDYNDTIPYSPKMAVMAEIVTEDKTVFERLFHQFLDMVNRR